MYCPADEKVIEDNADIVRGVEVEPGKWITVDDDELRAAAPKRSSSIEILDFVPLADIDPLYYDHPYLVLPGSALKPYRLLVEVLADMQLAGIARFVLHAREHYTALRVLEDQLCLITLRYQDELRSPKELELQTKPAAADVRKLGAAIGRLKAGFDPGLLEDDTNERVMALIKELEAKGPQETKQTKATAKRGAKQAEEDLSEALEASVAQARKARSAAKPPARKTAPKPTGRKTSARKTTAAARRRNLKVVE
jgi:DNA end-binding protein Ku